MTIDHTAMLIDMRGAAEQFRKGQSVDDPMQVAMRAVGDGIAQWADTIEELIVALGKSRALAADAERKCADRTRLLIDTAKILRRCEAHLAEYGDSDDNLLHDIREMLK